MRFPNPPRAFIPPCVQRVHPPGTDAGQGADPWLLGAAGTPQPPCSRGLPHTAPVPEQPQAGSPPRGWSPLCEGPDAGQWEPGSRRLRWAPGIRHHRPRCCPCCRPPVLAVPLQAGPGSSGVPWKYQRAMLLAAGFSRADHRVPHADSLPRWRSCWRRSGGGVTQLGARICPRSDASIPTKHLQPGARLSLSHAFIFVKH